MITGFSLCSFSHREIPVIKTGSLQCEQVSPVMKTGFSLGENPVLALYGIAVQPILKLLARRAVRILDLKGKNGGCSCDSYFYGVTIHKWYKFFCDII